MKDFSREIRYKTARSGGKGGQHVNKVETQVEGFWNIDDSASFGPEEKKRIRQKLSKRINEAGELHAKSNEHKSQLSNKKTVARRLMCLVEKALIREKPRIATKRTKASVEKRIQSKKILAERKQLRKKI